MNISNPPEGAFVDGDGKLTNGARVFLQQLVTQIQTKLSDEKYLLPQQPTTNVTILNGDAAKNTGGMLYNTTTDKFMVNIAGTYKDVTTA